MKENVEMILKKLEEGQMKPPPDSGIATGQISGMIYPSKPDQVTTAYIRILIKVQIIQTMMIARFLAQEDEIQQQLLSLFQEENSG